MNTHNKDGLTVKDAEKAYKLKGHNIRRWIRDGHVEAEKVGNEYHIKRKSLEAFLAEKQGPKIAAATKPEQAAVVTAGSKPTQAAATFPIPPEVLAGIDAAVKQPEQQPSQTPPPSSGNAKPPFDFKAGAKTLSPPAANRGAAALQKRQQPRRESKPPSSTSPRQPVPSGKKQGKDERHGAGKRYKKTPVLYAKNAMRHFDMAQMLDVCDWLLRRMDAKMNLA